VEFVYAGMNFYKKKSKNLNIQIDIEIHGLVFSSISHK